MPSPHHELLFVLGTRAEHIKMQSIWRALTLSEHHARVMLTGQHPDLVDVAQIQSDFPFTVDVLSPPCAGLPLNQMLATLLHALDGELVQRPPALTIVQGDTTSALAGALASFQRHVPVAHVEAGLRTPSLFSPFPEEGNRRLIARLATLHFAPTQDAAQNLYAEGVAPTQVFVTGNTIVDALGELKSSISPPPDDPYLLMTLHRREHLERLPSILSEILDVLDALPKARVLWPRHPNPTILAHSERILGAHPRVDLLDALPHGAFLSLLAHASAVLTDSGGLQEEAITLGKTLIVAREHSDRPEGLSSPHVYLARPSAPGELAAMLTKALSGMTSQGDVSRQLVYGDGRAGERIASHLRAFIEQRRETL